MRSMINRRRKDALSALLHLLLHNADVTKKIIVSFFFFFFCSLASRNAVIPYTLYSSCWLGFFYSYLSNQTRESDAELAP